jgi:hypothetical protein
VSIVDNNPSIRRAATLARKSSTMPGCRDASSANITTWLRNSRANATFAGA